MTSLQLRSRLMLLILGCSIAARADEPKPDPWEADIQKFEQADKQDPPPKDAVLFVGSSSIRLWDLKKFFPDLVAINRGFGGSQIADSLRLVERIVTPYKPRAIVFYAGDNDIASGKSPETVAKDFERFVQAVREQLPAVPIIYVGIKPSIQRWHLIDKIRDTNARIEKFCTSGETLTFVSVEKIMLGDDGKPNAELLQADGLHMTAKGYELWSELVRQKLPRP